MANSIVLEDFFFFNKSSKTVKSFIKTNKLIKLKQQIFFIFVIKNFYNYGFFFRLFKTCHTNNEYFDKMSKMINFKIKYFFNYRQDYFEDESLACFVKHSFPKFSECFLQ